MDCEEGSNEHDTESPIVHSATSHPHTVCTCVDNNGDEGFQGLINKFTQFFCRNALSTDVHERIFASTIHIVVMVYGNAQTVMMRAAVRVSIMCNLFLIR